jgi:transketolase
MIASLLTRLHTCRMRPDSVAPVGLDRDRFTLAAGYASMAQDRAVNGMDPRRD